MHRKLHADGFAAKIIGYYPDVSPLIKPQTALQDPPSDAVLAGGSRSTTYGAFESRTTSEAKRGQGSTFLGSESETEMSLGLTGDPDGPLPEQQSEPKASDAQTDTEENRLCSFREGSIRASVFNLCSATLGAGALSLPFAIKQASLVPGLLLLALGAAATLFSIQLLIRARDATGARSYEDLTVAVMGQRVGLVMEVCVIVFCFGCAIAYIIAVGDILQLVRLPLLASLGRTGGIYVFFFLVMLPWSMIDKVNDLRFTSFLGVLSIFYLVIAAAGHSLCAVGERGWADTWGRAPVLAFDTSGILMALPVMIFAYTCQTNVFSVYHGLARPSPERMGKVSHRAVLTCLSVYALIGVAGFLEFGENTEPNILFNYLPDIEASRGAASISSVPARSLAMVLACIAVAITVVMAFPLVVFPCRYTIAVLVFGAKANDNMPRWLHATLTLGICVCSLGVSLFVPTISAVFGLMGGTTSSFVCFVLPALITLRLDSEKRGLYRIGAWALAICGSALGLASTVATLRSLVLNGGR